jgi:hypothetical protein
VSSSDGGFCIYASMRTARATIVLLLPPFVEKEYSAARGVASAFPPLPLRPSSQPAGPRARGRRERDLGRVLRRCGRRPRCRRRSLSGFGPAIRLKGSSENQRSDAANSHTPPAINPPPAIREIRRPAGMIFSARTKIAMAAIHSTFITPPTNNSAISAQQQPTQ